MPFMGILASALSADRQAFNHLLTEGGRNYSTTKWKYQYLRSVFVSIVVDTHGQARGTFQKQASLDALRASPHSPTAKAVELCPTGF